MDVGGARCRGVYGTYLGVATGVEWASTAVVEEDEMEDEEEPGRVGESNGCAVRDSCELVRTMAP